MLVADVFLRQRISAIEVLGQLLLNMTNLIPALVLLLYQSTEAGVEKRFCLFVEMNVFCLFVEVNVRWDFARDCW